MPTFERIIPVLTYQGIPAAPDFLVHAFGFAAAGVHRSPECEPIHGEVRAGDAPIWLHRVMAEYHLDSPRVVEGPAVDARVIVRQERRHPPCQQRHP